MHRRAKQFPSQKKEKEKLGEESMEKPCNSGNEYNFPVILLCFLIFSPPMKSMLVGYSASYNEVCTHIPHVSISFYDRTDKRVPHDIYNDEYGEYRCHGNSS